MKTIGMLGGMSWESTVPYYQQINRVIGERPGGLHSSRLELRRSAEGLVARGAEAVILGCTELAMLLTDGDLNAPVLDGTELHAREAALMAIEEELALRQMA
jgi:aspartate/glutamate racemase